MVSDGSCGGFVVILTDFILVFSGGFMVASEWFYHGFMVVLSSFSGG